MPAVKGRRKYKEELVIAKLFMWCFEACEHDIW